MSSNAPAPDTAPAEKSTGAPPPPQRVRAIYPIVVGIVVVTFIAGAIAKNAKSPDFVPEATTGPVPENAIAAPRRPLAATLPEFTDAIPLLGQREPKTQQHSNGRASWMWENLSVLDLAHSLVLHDENQDGRPELGTIIFSFPKGNTEAAGESTIIAFKVISVATGSTLDPDVFRDWFVQVFKTGAGQRIDNGFRTDAKLRALPGGMGAMMTVSINHDQ